MTTSTMDIYEASASDCTTTQPPLLTSRKPSYRKLHSRNSVHYKRRKRSYHNRRLKRIRESDYPELSSSDEHDPPPPLTQSGLPNPNFLPHMPRPSDVVHAIHDGSASDAGFDKHARQVHKRRVDAMRILLASIDSRGNIIPVPHWKRSKAGLTKYTTYMNPPQEDNNLPDLRVPSPLLSRYYRGSLLAVNRVGRPAKRPRKDVHTTASPEASAVHCEYFGTSSSSDFEVTTPQIIVKSEPEQIVQHHDQREGHVGNTEKHPVNAHSFSKAAFLEELERVADGSSCDISDDDMQRLLKSGVRKSLSSRSQSDQDQDNANGNVCASQPEIEVRAKPKGQSKSQPAAGAPDEAQEISEPEKKSEIDLLKEMLTKNPELLFEEQKPLDKEALAVKGPDVEEEPTEDAEESDSNLTAFEKDKRLAMMFSHNTRKRPRSTAKDIAAMYLQRSKRQKQVATSEADDVPISNGTPDPDSRMNLKFTMKLMNKMGFTGRLGKKEDGRKDPVLPTRRDFRSGIGSRPVQTPARRGGGDQSLLPTKFKGKSVENGNAADSSDAPGTTVDGEIRPNGVVSSNANGNLTDCGDAFTRRRKRKANASERESQPKQDAPTSGARRSAKGSREKKKAPQLDDDDIYETGDENEGVDNGRRGILIDMDVLIKGSSKRRVDAIKKVLSDASLTSDVEKLLAREPRDLCEVDLLCKVLGYANVKPHDMEDFKDKLDEAFESLPPPELDVELVDLLRQYSREVHFGIFHRGSRRRLQYDLKMTGLINSFLQEVCTTVKHEDKWPYIDTWQDLTCRVGVGPRQCLYILNEDRTVKCKGEARPLTGVAAGACLGAQTAVWERVDDGLKICIRGRKEKVVEIINASGYDDRRKVFDEVLKNRMPVLKRRRALAQYDDDLLWYSAVVMYEGKRNGKSWIKFNKFGNSEWVCNEDLVTLCRRDYRKMKMMDFPGLIDSDTSVL